MKEIYILLTYTGTILSNIIKIFTKCEYAHSSIGLDKDLDKLYSFGRLNPYNPFKGGFIKEGIDIGTFKRFKNTKAQLYSLEITDKQYDNIKRTIKNIEDKSKTYKFNTLGLFATGINKKIKKKYTFYCSEFVRYVLKRAKVSTHNLPILIKPEDFKNLEGAKLIYSGYLRDYKKYNKKL